MKKSFFILCIIIFTSVYKNAVALPTYTIALNGPCLFLSKSDIYIEYGATAKDSANHDSSKYIVISGYFNPNVAGKYILSYQIDSTKGHSNIVKRTIVVANLFCNYGIDTFITYINNSGYAHLDSLYKFENYCRSLFLNVIRIANIDSTKEGYYNYKLVISDSNSTCYDTIQWGIIVSRLYISLIGKDTICLHHGENYIDDSSQQTFHEFFTIYMPRVWIRILTNMPLSNVNGPDYIFVMDTNGCYFFKYVMSDPAGISDTARRWVCNCFVGINEVNKDKNFIIYPNPVTHFIQIKNTNQNQQIQFVKIYNLLGSNVLEQKFEAIQNQELKLSVEELNSGIYFLEIKTESGITHKKIEIVKN